MSRSVDPSFKLFYVFIGAVGAALYTADSPSAAIALERLFPGREDYVYARIDFVLAVIFSTVLARFLYNPADQGRCLIAGLSGVALLQQALTRLPRQRRGGKR
jgi:hypothetical protein